jgi:galactose mutarotase-like enzyme
MMSNSVWAAANDHNWVLDRKLAEAAEVYDPSSGRLLQVLTDQPGIQLYTGNFLDGSVRGKGGEPYQFRSALCPETQHFPRLPASSAFSHDRIEGDRELLHGYGPQFVYPLRLHQELRT